MLALYRSGRQADALEAYRDARAALVDQIGVEPGAELQRLHEAILRHDPSLALDDEARAPELEDGDPAVVMCPFKGLASFDVEDAEVFFGREQLVSETIARLAGSSLLGRGRTVGLRQVLGAARRAAGFAARGALPGSERWTDRAGAPRRAAAAGARAGAERSARTSG